MFKFRKATEDERNEISRLQYGGRWVYSDADMSDENFALFFGKMKALFGEPVPSLHEGLPLTLIEEQANGLPCIVSDVITREADKTGLLEFQSLQTTASAWADRICKIVLSEAERGEQSVQAIESIRQCGFDICGQADRLKEFYKSLLK